MLQGKKKAVLLGLALALAVTGLTTGCHLFDEDEDLSMTTHIETTEMAETETDTEAETETEAESETETETEAETNVVYISEDGTIRIILPDTTWKATQDIDEMRVFTSGSDAMINIVHADTPEEMQNISVMESRDELMESLLSQYPEENEFEIMSFDERSSSTVQIYEYVVHYTYSTSMWAYSVTYGILSADGDAAYVVSGTVTDDDKELLEAVQTSVESFSVLDQSSVFSVLPGIVKNNDSDDDDDEDEEEELADLTEYATPLTLYAADDVNIREKPSTDADVLGSLKAGDTVSVTGETKNWFRVSADNSVGYVNKEFLSYTEPEVTAASGTYYADADVNIRSTPSADGDIVGSLSAGSAVTVIGESGDWYEVSVNGTTGYISKSYVTSSGSDYASADEGTYTDTYEDTYTDNTYTDNTYTDTYTDNTYTDDTYTDTYTDTYAQPDANITVTPDQSQTTADAGSTSSGSTYSSSTGMISGTVTAVSGDTVAVEGSDGSTYYIDYSDAGDLAVGSDVSATVDYAQDTSNGALYATSVY